MHVHSGRSNGIEGAQECDAKTSQLRIQLAPVPQALVPRLGLRGVGSGNVVALEAQMWQISCHSRHSTQQHITSCRAAEIL